MKSIKTKVMTILLLLTVMISFTSCDFSKEKPTKVETNNQIASINTDELNTSSTSVLVKYTKAVEAYRKGVAENLAYSNQTGISIETVKGPEWRKELWTLSLDDSNADKAYNTFKTKYGEERADVLYLKISNIINKRNLP